MTKAAAGHRFNSAELSYPKLIAHFLHAQSFHYEHGGYHGFRDELVADGVVRLRDKLLVFASRVLCELPDSLAGKPTPCIWFYVCRDDAADGFVVEVSRMIEALEEAPPSMDASRVPVPAFRAEDLDGDTVQVGKLLYLTLKVVELDRPGVRYQQQRTGIRFELRGTLDGEPPPLFTFSMDGLTPFLALAVALDETPSGPSTFSEELEELAQEIESSVLEES